MSRALARPLSTALFVLASGPLAAQPYPAHPVRIIVPFEAGGSVDLIARLLAQKLGERTRNSFIVENRGGGGGNIGAAFVAQSAPDGHTLLMASTAQAVNATLYRKLPYDLLRDLLPISLVAINPSVLIVHPAVPVKSVKDLVMLAKARPGTLTYASSGSGSSSHLAAELLKISTGIDLLHVPFKGAGPALTALVGGHVELLITITAAALPFIRSGKLRALAVTSTRRAAALPGVPTMQEAGVSGYEVNVWTGLMAPAGTRNEIITYINVETDRALKELAERFTEMEAYPAASTPAQFSKFLRNEIDKWAGVVKRSNAKVE